jgi:hypothetical protein
MTKVINVLEQLGELEWYAIRPGQLATGDRSRPLFPPLVTFRYKSGNRIPFEKLCRVVSDYTGPVRWTVTDKGRKNLCLMPERLHQMTSQGVATMDAVRSLITTDPAFVDSALNDFEQLLGYLKQSFSKPGSE